MKTRKWFGYIITLLWVLGASFFITYSEKAIEIYGKLIIALLGFVAPSVGLMITLFHEGFVKLKKNYNEKIEKAEQELAQFIKKREGISGTEALKELKKNINELEKSKAGYEKKLSQVDIKKQIKKLFVPLFGALFLVCIYYHTLYFYQVKDAFEGLYSIVSCSVFLFTISLITLWSLLCILIEVKEVIEISKNEKEDEKNNLLTKIYHSIHVPTDKIFLRVDDMDLSEKPTECISIPINEKQMLKINIINSTNSMLKHFELGMEFPRCFTIEKSNEYSETETKDTLILRNGMEKIQANTNQSMHPITITGTVVGEYVIKAFLKGENISGQSLKNLKIHVVDKTSKEIKKL